MHAAINVLLLVHVHYQLSVTIYILGPIYMTGLERIQTGTISFRS
jgi:hypothetical protein